MVLVSLWIAYLTIILYFIMKPHLKIWFNCLCFQGPVKESISLSNVIESFQSFILLYSFEFKIEVFVYLG